MTMLLKNTICKFVTLFMISAAVLIFSACGDEKEEISQNTSAHDEQSSFSQTSPTPESQSSSSQVSSTSEAQSNSSQVSSTSEAQSSSSQVSSTSEAQSSSSQVSSTSEAQSSSSQDPSATEAQSSSSQVSSTSEAQSTPAVPEGNNSPSQASVLTDNGSLSPLHVDGTFLVNESGEHVQLYGMSTHGLSFFPEYVNYDTFATLHDDWGTNCVRLAMYTAEYNGYCTGGDKETLKNLIRNGVQYATDLGMYVIVDWHILSDQDPNVYKEEAKAFFAQMSEEFADYTNVLYEICNEPNGYATWESVKSYAEEVIPCIRQNDEDAVILIGSPTWSQDIDKALANPVNADNIMYTLHFYAGTHKDYLRERLENCVTSGLPVFISEFGMCDASGNGGNDFDSAQKWIDLINKYDISFLCWNLANKNETSSVIRSDVAKVSGWSEDELSDSGKWIRSIFRNK